MSHMAVFEANYGPQLYIYCTKEFTYKSKIKLNPNAQIRDHTFSRSDR